MKIQFRFLAILLAVCLVLGLALWGIHSFQVRRSATALLAAAEAAAEKGELQESLRLYSSYTSFEPSAKAFAAMGDLYDQLGNPTQAFFQLESALRLDPQDTATRKKLVSTALKLQRFSDARTHLEDLLKSTPDDSELLFQRVTALIGVGDNDTARSELQSLVDNHPQNVEYSGALAGLLSKQFSDVTKARKVLDNLVANAPADADAWLARAQFLLEQTRTMVVNDNAARSQLLKQAGQDAAESLALEPEELAPRLLSIEIALANKENQRAEALALEGIRLEPKEPRFYGGAAQVKLASKDPEAAVRILKQGLQALPGNGDLLWNLAQLEMDAGREDNVRALIQQLEAADFPSAGTRYLQAQLAARAGEYQEAIQLLESSRALMDINPQLLVQADFLLAQCYRSIGNQDEQLTILRRVVKSSPMWAPGREALASSLMQSGRFNEAVTEYEQIVWAEQPTLSAILSFARLRLIQGLGSQGQADWSQLEQILRVLEQYPEAAEDLVILKAELAVAKGNAAEALALLENFVEQTPASPNAWQALVALTARGDSAEDTLQLIERARGAVGDTVGLRVAEAQNLILASGKETKVEELKRLTIPSNDWTDQEKSFFASSLASLYRQVEQFDLARDAALEVSRSKFGKNDLAIHLLLLDLAFNAKDLEAMDAALKRIEEIDGQGPLWRVGLAIKATVMAEDPEISESQAAAYNSQALNNLTEAAVERPQWATIPSLMGQIYDELGQTDLAVEKFQSAIILGEQNPDIVARTIYLLFESGRFVQADEIVRRLQQQRSPFSSSVARVATQVSLQLENFDRALELAQAAAKQSGKQEDYIWLAQVYDISGNQEAAEKELQTAIKLDPSKPFPWVSLIQMVARRGDTEKARRFLKVAEEKIDAKEVHAALAQIYEALKDDQQAIRNFQLALDEDPSNTDLAIRYIEYSLRIREPATSERLLEGLLVRKQDLNEEELQWARRTLGLILASKGSDEALQRAEQLVQENMQVVGNNLDDRRVLAVVLSRKPTEVAKRNAISLLQNIISEEPKFSMADHRLLARLYAQFKEWTLYRRTMQTIIGNGGGKDPEVVREYADNLLASGAPDEAALWLDALKRLAPDSLSTFSIDAQLLYSAGDIAALMSLIKQKSELEGGLRWAGATAEKHAEASLRDGKTENARMLLELAAESYEAAAASSPQDIPAYAEFLARQGRVDEALKTLGDTTSEQLLSLTANALSRDKSDDQQLEYLIEKLVQQSGSDPQNAALLITIADVHSWKGDVDAALTYYQKSLAVDKRSIVALNNLATLLGLTRQKTALAMDSINEAIKLIGPQDFLLDTRGTVLLAADNPQAAEADFRASLGGSTRADKFFHLAQALYAQGKIAEARTAFAQAVDGGVAAELLHPLERPGFEELAKRL